MRPRDPYWVLLAGFGGRPVLSEETDHGVQKTP
jgi:hypothetical protein